MGWGGHRKSLSYSVTDEQCHGHLLPITLLLLMEGVMLWVGRCTWVGEVCVFTHGRRKVLRYQLETTEFKSKRMCLDQLHFFARRKTSVSWLKRQQGFLQPTSSWYLRTYQCSCNNPCFHLYSSPTPPPLQSSGEES